MAETLAHRPGETVVVDEMASAVWPGKPPQDFKHRLEFLMVSVRKALPGGYIKTEYQKLSKWSWPRTRGPLIGWRLVGKINVHTAAGAAD
jgi:hypothetical protein